MPRDVNPDDVPFQDDEWQRRAGAVILVGGVGTSWVPDAETLARARKALEDNLLQWANKRGFARAGSHLECTIDGVLVRLPIYEVSAETAVLEARTARLPPRLSMSIGPKTWSHQLGRKLGLYRGRGLTQDPAFDEAWHVAATDEGIARQLVDARCRAALQGVAAATVTYRDGEIEVRVGSARLSGGDVMRGVEVAVALACAQVGAAAYR